MLIRSSPATGPTNEPSGRKLLVGSMAALAAAVTLLSGCVRFDPTQDQPFTEVPRRGVAQTTTTPPPPLPGKPFPKQCPAEGVMQGCLEATSGLIMGSDGKTALVAERATGVIKEIATSAEPKIKTTIPVDPSGDGGLSDIVLSPSYQQDRLMYAYISTPTDNRVVRVADGDVPKDILTGIPKGPTGNAGSLAFTSPTTLVVQTGTGGNAGAANDPNSLAGKVIRIEQPTTVGQTPPTTAMSGLGDGGAMCVDAANGALYVTDRAPAGDRLQKLTRTARSQRCGPGRTSRGWPDVPHWTAR
ncbi:Probable conserved lipoprotein LppZ [Mycobacteroides abscessus]|nr:Probable conserved lipoprotein LppZ [Mycobacteroides abscessus]